MLLMKRRVGEEAIINGVMTAKVLKMTLNYVLLGFDFPKGQTVLRKELHLRIQADKDKEK